MRKKSLVYYSQQPCSLAFVVAAENQGEAQNLSKMKILTKSL